MVGDRTHPSEAVTRKPDDSVGKAGPAPVADGRQTPEQAAITDLGGDGRSDGDREQTWGGTGAGRNPVPVGGASQGHADQKVSGDGDHEKSARGHYNIERERG